MDSVRLELSFSGVAPIPAPQTVVLHAGAPAWFEFPCPCADCDGSIDLATQVAAVVKAGGRRTAGSLGCPGGRVLGGQTSPCNLQAAYVITGTRRAQPATDAPAQPLTAAAISTRFGSAMP
jgi:hypothetical protein